MLPRLLATLAFLASATAAEAQAPPPDGRRIFLQCQSCHALQPGQNRVGPSLAGIVGRPAARAPKFNYSPAMKQSGLVWNEATLDRFLANPRQVVPGNRMAFVGLRDPAQRRALIGYLKTAAPPTAQQK